jgi:hypothetical protein
VTISQVHHSQSFLLGTAVVFAEIQLSIGELRAATISIWKTKQQCHILNLLTCLCNLCQSFIFYIKNHVFFFFFKQMKEDSLQKEEKHTPSSATRPGDGTRTQDTKGKKKSCFQEMVDMGRWNMFSVLVHCYMSTLTTASLIFVTNRKLQTPQKIHASLSWNPCSSLKLHVKT